MLKNATSSAEFADYSACFISLSASPVFWGSNCGCAEVKRVRKEGAAWFSCYRVPRRLPANGPQLLARWLIVMKATRQSDAPQAAIIKDDKSKNYTQSRMKAKICVLVSERASQPRGKNLSQVSKFQTRAAANAEADWCPVWTSS